VRLRLVLGIAVALVVGALLLDMSGTAPRMAGGDRVSAPVFVATVPPGGTICQPGLGLASEVKRVQFLLGTFGHPAPAIGVRFLNTAGSQVASGHLAAGAREGLESVPIGSERKDGAVEMCIRFEGGSAVVLGGESAPPSPSSAVVNGHRQTGLLSVSYFRGGSESWWQLLPTLSRRFGLGKASVFGTWTLPLMALLLTAVWVATIRLLKRELV
jgi:hypothetical protein